MPARRTTTGTAPGTQEWTLTFKSDHRTVVRYQNDDGVNFYAPKPVCGLPNPPDTIVVSIRPGR